MSELIVVLNIADRIATVARNDPDRRNPITGNEMIAALLGAFDQEQRNPEVSGMILHRGRPGLLCRRHQGDGRPRKRVPQRFAGFGGQLHHRRSADTARALQSRSSHDRGRQ